MIIKYLGLDQSEEHRLAHKYIYCDFSIQKCKNKALGE